MTVISPEARRTLSDSSPPVAGGAIEYADAAVVDPPAPHEVSPADREPPEEQGEREIEREEIADPFLPQAGGVPDWIKLPKGFKFPRGVRPMFVRFRAAWTRAPHKGDRTCVLWELTDVEEFAAAQRAAGQPWRSTQEFAKQMLRVIDGHEVDWTGEDVAGGIDAFWRDIGAKCRAMLTAIYSKTHSMEMSERVDFFVNCLVVRPAG